MNNTDHVKVIVNADDLGMDARTNELVSELMLKKRITSATIMANGVACEEAVAMQKIFPGCSFGVHLNLTSGRPLSGNVAPLMSILDINGRFAGLDALTQAQKNLKFLNALYHELSMQIEKLSMLGLNISHVDSHQHVHNIPSIFLIVKMLQKKYCIRKIRLSKNMYLPDDINTVRSLKKRMFNFFLRKMYYSISTDLFTDFETFYQVGESKKGECRSVEIMVHLRENCSGWSDYLVLKSPWESKMIFSVELIPYGKLC